MRRLTQPPKFNFISVDPKELVRYISDVDLQSFVQKANAKYLHWDEVRRRALPSGFSAEQVWEAIQLTRMARRSLPLKDHGGRAFAYWIPDTFQETLKEVDQGGAGTLLTDATGLLDSDARRQIVRSTLMDEAIATSQIEGAVTTRSKARALLRSRRPPRNKSEQMVVNSYATMNMLTDLCKQPLSESLLHTLQTSITHRTLDDPEMAGQYRRAADEIVLKDSQGEIVFVPPPADQLARRMRLLIDFANQDHTGLNFIHPLVKAAILHFWLAYEHPYVDGNGRTARTLFYWFLRKQGYWMFEYLTISQVVHEAPSQYAQSFLFSETDTNDVTYSIYRMLSVTRKAIVRLQEALAQKHEETQRTNSIVSRFKDINYRQRQILIHAVANPDDHYTIQTHQTSHDVTYETARSDFEKLVALKLFLKTKIGRQNAYIAVADLNRKLTGTRRKS